ncbi:adenine DNA glycosylase-like [Frankliniella occidentalis]|uniref:Adenine DNA glycosylase n=1 Tax=Frankliniella occidentalis TaxID=133901 RepID=A0A6J1SP27_FRAOC|nr:adenine DNA glycosylase-like [Frankliniella occidentalis]
MSTRAMKHAKGVKKGKGSKRPASSPDSSCSESKRTRKESLAYREVHSVHNFSVEEAKDFTSSLLKWYHKNKRDLPWRSLAGNLSSTDRAYSVLVSEVMLQQTQVATVIPYYTKWLARWPTFHHLAQASLNDVNEVWSGMGYYSRAKRLWEAAKKVDGELNNQVPLTSAELQNQLPGVGRYTAGAVASIAFGEKAAAVDGNVIRVLSRVRCIGADQTSKVVLDHIWKLSDQLVSPDEPGNYNQAMMDLGATICTPKKPSCSSCPLSHICRAQQRVQQANPLKELQIESKPSILDIEDASCLLCLKSTWNNSLGVMNFPQKSKKAPPRKEVTLVCVFHVESDNGYEYLVTKRPQGGLLAGLWEFPNLLFEGNREDDDKEEEKKQLEKTLLRKQWGASKSIRQPQYVADVPHIFSHIHQMYVVYSLKLDSKTDICCDKKELETEWMKSDGILTSAISTAMKKVFKTVSSSHETITSISKKVQHKSKKAIDKNTRKVSDFFQKVQK